MMEQRYKSLWPTRRKSFLKAYLWFALILIGIGLIVFCSRNESKIHLIPPEEPESISSDILWNNAGSDMTTRVIYDVEGNLCALGTCYNEGSEDVLFLKYNSNRSLLSQTTWGGSEKDRGLAMDADSDGNLYITGFTRSFLAVEEDLLLIKCNPNGSIDWSTYLDLGTNKGDFGLGISIYKNQSIYVTGYYWDYNFMVGDYFKWYLAKFSTNGTLLWLETGAPIVGGGMGEDVAVDEASNVYISGYHALDDSFLMKFNENGTKLWERSWGIGCRMEWGKTLLLHNSLSVITCAGYIQDEGLFFNQYDTAGNFVQSKVETVAPPEHFENGNSKMVLDGDGNLLIPWIDVNRNAHVSKYNTLSLERLYDLVIPSITPQHGFGIAYNYDKDEILVLGNQGANALLITVQDVENPLEITYQTEIITHFSLFTFILGIILLVSVSGRYGVKYSYRGYGYLVENAKEKREKLIYRVREISKVDESQIPRYSEEFYEAIFDKEHPILWKNERTKKRAYLEWKTSKELERLLEITPAFGHCINLWEEGVPSDYNKLYPWFMVEWMTKLQVWGNCDNIVAYLPDDEDRAKEKEWTREYQKEKEFVKWLLDNYFG